MVSWKIVSVLTQIWESSPGKFDLFLWYCSFSWKILCVLTKFWTRFHAKFDLFLWYFLFLENHMCFCRILRKISWKFWCVLVIFLGLLENLMCSFKRIMSSPGKLRISYHNQVSWKIWCVLKKVTPGKKEQIF